MNGGRKAVFFIGKMAKLILPKGTTSEQSVFTEVYDHYSTSKEDLEQRIQRKNGFNDADKFVSSYIDEKSWPYKSIVFDPRPYTVILEKSARLIGSKPKGRLVPREGGDTLGAYVNNELLSFQWDDNSRLGETMIAKWIQMDQNARKYGSAFGICKWRYETKAYSGKRKTHFDGPDFVVCNPRDVLANPSYPSIQRWFQYREYVTIQDLENVNDSAKGEPIYKNLDILKDSVRDGGPKKGDGRDANYVNYNKSMRGLSDYLGHDEAFKTVEIVTEYRADRWITFAPKYGVVIRDVKNPYSHCQIPVVHLRYYPLGDDLYGMSEFEPVSKLVRAINSFLSQFVDRMAIRLYPPLMINPVNVRMHTLDFSPEAKWLMNNPGQDVQQFQFGSQDVTDFNAVYQTLVGALQNAWGEQSQGFSNVNPMQDNGKVTATEIRDSAFTRNVRDNMNQIFLSDALKKQMMFWHSMNQQFMFTATDKAKIVRIVGRDAVEFFQRKGLADIRPTNEDVQMVAEGKMTNDQIAPGPRYAVDLGDGVVSPKFRPDENGDGGELLVEPSDLSGFYDYIPDIETMRAPTDQDVEGKLSNVMATITNPAVLQGLQQEGLRPKYKEILVKLFEATKVIKDADAYFGEAQSVQPNTTGGGVVAPGPQGQGVNPAPGMGPGPAPVSPIQNPQLLGGPA